MGEPSLPATTIADEVFFELDRFEHAGDDRLELSGRWYGIRGRRFVRPTLTLLSGEESLRALADLEHKPWAAEEGEPWEAAFHCDAEEFADVQLAVAPDIAVALPAPGANGEVPQRLAAVPQPTKKRAAPKRSKRRPSKPATEVPATEVEMPEVEVPPAEQAPPPEAPADDELQRLREELASSQSAHREIKAAFEKRNAIVKELRQALSERLADEQARGRAAQELQSREAELSDRDSSLASREASLDARESSLAEREEALSTFERPLTERKEQLEERQKELDKRAASLESAQMELGSSQDAVKDRTAKLDRRERELTEREHALAEREQELAAGRVPSSPAPVYPRLEPAARPGPADAGVWFQRAFAVVFLIVPIVAVLILTKTL